MSVATPEDRIAAVERILERLAIRPDRGLLLQCLLEDDADSLPPREDDETEEHAGPRPGH